jgi:hypothetical protein
VRAELRGDPVELAAVECLDLLGREHLRQDRLAHSASPTHDAARHCHGRRCCTDERSGSYGASTGHT